MNAVLLKRKVQVHLLVKQQWSQVYKVHFGLILGLELKWVLVPSDDLVVFLFLFGWEIFKDLQEWFLFEIFLLNFLYLFFYFDGFAVVRETLRILFEELQFICPSLLQLFQHLFFQLYTYLWVNLWLFLFNLYFPLYLCVLLLLIAFFLPWLLFPVG